MGFFLSRHTRAHLRNHIRLSCVKSFYHCTYESINLPWNCLANTGSIWMAAILQWVAHFSTPRLMTSEKPARTPGEYVGVSSICASWLLSQYFPVFFTLPHCTAISTEALELEISLQARRSMGNWTITVRVLRIGTSRQLQQKPQGSRAPNPEDTDPELYCTKNSFGSSPSAKSRSTRDCFPGHRHSPRQPGLLPRSREAQIHYCRGSCARRVRSSTSSHTRFFAMTISCRGAISARNHKESDP